MWSRLGFVCCVGKLDLEALKCLPGRPGLFVQCSCLRPEECMDGSAQSSLSLRESRSEVVLYTYEKLPRPERSRSTTSLRLPRGPMAAAAVADTNRLTSLANLNQRDNIDRGICVSYIVIVKFSQSYGTTTKVANKGKGLCVCCTVT